MEYDFENDNLVKLYETGKSGKYKLQPDVIDKFFLRTEDIEAAVSIFDLIEKRSLNFEKLKKYKNRYSMRLNLKYRLEFSIEWKDEQKGLGKIIILDISNHYKD
ncbi:MAG: type II toxin-antitoxin system RelE/ParE family toxin [Spirochaetes bacterium]|nr:type II toxin-antitoxin system RelE/ParE family toxin [Spirochaetota bacterium]